jgi:hypothetical protein
MSEIKPVAVISIDYYSGYVGYRNVNTDLIVDLPEGRHDVYMIPKTHRIVPVELLKRMLPGGGSWNLEELRAIIDEATA